MKDGKITLNRAVKCYEPCRLSPEDDRYGRSETFYKRYGFHFEEVWNLDGEAARRRILFLQDLSSLGKLDAVVLVVLQEELMKLRGQQLMQILSVGTLSLIR